MAALFLGRGLANLLGLSQPTEFLANNTLQAATFMFSYAGQIFAVTGLVYLNMQRLEQELSLSQSEVSLLSGLLPICANCKRIRDDQGYWHQTERENAGRGQQERAEVDTPEMPESIFSEALRRLVWKWE